MAIYDISDSNIFLGLEKEAGRSLIDIIKGPVQYFLSVYTSIVITS